MHTLLWFDNYVSRLVDRLPPRLLPVSIAVGYCALPLVWSLIIVLTALFAYPNDQAILGYVAVLVLMPLANVLKLLVKRRRPPIPAPGVRRLGTYSFPSSHAYAAALAGGYLAYTSYGAGYNLAALSLVGLIVLIGISRIHLGVHYASDVVAGWLLGAVMLIGCNLINSL